MKLKNLFLTGAAAALALTSCTSLDDNSSWDGQTASTISFKSYINGQKTSRATGTTWAEGDRVGIYMKATGNTVAAATAANKLYITDSKGNMTASSTSEAIAYPESGNVDFVAYYPYSASVADGIVDVDVTDQSTQESIDLLYSNNATNISSSTSTVNLGFSHQLSNIILSITADATIASTSGLTVTLTGTDADATFNLNDGALTLSGSTSNVALNVNANGTAAEAIVVPQTVSDAKLQFTLNGTTIEAALPLTSLAAGTRYTIPVTLSNSGGQTYVSFGTATITDWTDVKGSAINVDFNGGDVTPDPTPQPGEEVTIFEETFGDNVEKNGSYWPSLDLSSLWTSTSGLTFSDPVMTANGWSYSNISIRQTSTLTPPRLARRQQGLADED
ncbi:MAG: fimbrillin family protein [Bacteroidales bacterium]|nr:fimbrillin family protein [Bacteroidales bacterium]